MIDKNVLRKIKKALALSENNPSPEEAQTALLKAQEMMAKHNISMSDIQLGEEDKKEAFHISVNKQNREQWWYGLLASIIADNFRVFPYYRGKTLTFLGLKEDAELAKEVYNFAFESINKFAAEYVKKLSNNGFPTKGIRNDFISGFLKGLSEKFKKQVEENNWGLVLIKDAVVVQEFNKMDLKKEYKRSYAKSAGNKDAINAGYEKGLTFNSLEKR